MKYFDNSPVRAVFTGIAACLLMLVACDAASAQENGSSSYVLKLTDDSINSLTSDGQLVSRVNAEYRGRISTIVISHVDVAENDAVEAGDVQVVASDDSVSVVVNDSLVADLRTAPVRIPVSGLEFTKIEFNYVASASTTTVQAEDAPAVVAPQNRVYFVQLGPNDLMRGTIDGFDEFEMESKFGKVTIPMEYVAGIKFHSDADDNAVVVFSNGDALTGKPTVAAVSLKTGWGQADIEPEFMQSITTSPNATFSRETSPDFGSRWMLRTAIPVQPQQRNSFGGDPAP
ncbi:MAG: hypothetical protein AAF456_03700 [Planctomycetota bacterium]